MSIDQNDINRILGAARARDPHKVHELWVTLQGADQELAELKTFMTVASEVAKRGDKDKAADLLCLLTSDLKAAEREDELFDVLRTAVGYSARLKGVREELTTQYRRKYADRPGLEAVLSKTDLAGEGRIQDAVRLLDEAFYYAAGEFVFHGRGWGVGKIVEANPATGDFLIDFAKNRGQRMDAAMALKALERREPDDLDVLLWTDPDAVRDLSKSDPLELLRKALVANGGKLQSRDLKTKLADVLPKSLWTKFWAAARKLAKADPSIEIGTTPRSVIALRDKPLSRAEEVAYQVCRYADFKPKIVLARRELQAVSKSSKAEEPSWLRPVVEEVSKGRRKSGNSEVSVAASFLEVAFFKADAALYWPEALPNVTAVGPAVDPETGEPLVDSETGEPLETEIPNVVKEAMAGLEGELADGLHFIAVPEYRKRAVNLVAKTEPETAAQTLESILLNPAPQLFNETVKVLNELGQGDVIIKAVTQMLISPLKYPTAMCAFARARLNRRLDILPDRTDAEILVKTISVLENCSLKLQATTERKKKALLKTLVDNLRSVLGEKNQRVLGIVLEAANENEVRRILQLVRQSPTLTATLKRATEKFVAERFPDLLALVTVGSGARTGENDAALPLYTTEEGKHKQEDLLTEIMDVKMPYITIEIGKALEFGDISENAELDAAREKQQRLAEQATRITNDLERAIIINLDEVETDEVRVGTRVVATNSESNTDETYSILGPWDLSDDDDTIISHMSALATGLMGRSEGDEAVIKLPGGKTATYVIKSIGRAVLQKSES